MEATKKAAEGKFLTFRLGREEYGIEITKVREIIGLMEITPVPQAADHVRGVINLRGKIVPVLDLRKKFGLSETEATRDTCIITVMFEGGEKNALVGLMVDVMGEVVLVGPGQVEPIPTVGEDLKVDFLLGLVKSRERIVVLLDVDQVVKEQDFRALLAIQTEK